MPVLVEIPHTLSQKIPHNWMLTIHVSLDIKRKYNASLSSYQKLLANDFLHFRDLMFAGWDKNMHNSDYTRIWLNNVQTLTKYPNPAYPQFSLNTILIQQEGVTLHYLLYLRHFLDLICSKQWIKRPAKYSDLTLLYFLLLRFVKRDTALTARISGLKKKS